MAAGGDSEGEEEKMDLLEVWVMEAEVVDSEEVAGRVKEED